MSYEGQRKDSGKSHKSSKSFNARASQREDERIEGWKTADKMANGVKPFFRTPKRATSHVDVL